MKRLLLGVVTLCAMVGFAWRRLVDFLTRLDDGSAVWADGLDDDTEPRTRIEYEDGTTPLDGVPMVWYADHSHLPAGRVKVSPALREHLLNDGTVRLSGVRLDDGQTVCSDMKLIAVVVDQALMPHHDEITEVEPAPQPEAWQLCKHCPPWCAQKEDPDHRGPCVPVPQSPVPPLLNLWGSDVVDIVVDPTMPRGTMMISGSEPTDIAAELAAQERAYCGDVHEPHTFDDRTAWCPGRS